MIIDSIEKCLKMTQLFMFIFMKVLSGELKFGTGSDINALLL